MTGDPEKAPVAIVTGAGPGTGHAIARRFAAGGYRTAMIARRAERLQELAAAVSAELAADDSADPAGDVTPYTCDVADPDALQQTLDRIRAELGPARVLVHNAVRARFGSFAEITAEDLERNFAVNTTSLLRLAQVLTPDMMAANDGRGDGAIICTGNTSAHRGKARFAGFAPTKAAQRILAQAMARDLGPKGVHVAYVTIDAVIDQPLTRQGAFADRPDDFFITPAAIADEIWHVAHQNRSAWSFDVELRPFGETW